MTGHVHWRNFHPRFLYVAADIFERPNYGGRCLGVSIDCKSGIKTIGECGELPEDTIFHADKASYDASAQKRVG